MSTRWKSYALYRSLRSLAAGWCKTVVGTALVLVACERFRDDAPTAAPKPSATAVGEVVPLLPARWEPEQEYVFDVILNNHTTLGAGTLTRFKLRAAMKLQNRAISGGSQFAMRLERAVFEAEGKEAQKNFDELAKELEKPALFTIEEGRLVDPKLAKDATPFAITITRTLAAALQVSPRSRTAENPWTALERDATGDYVAEYRYVAGSPQLLKRKLEYKTLTLGNDAAGVKPAQVTTEVTRSQGHVTLNDHRLSEVHYDETLALVSLPGTPAIAKTEVTLTLDRTHPLATAPDWQSLERELRSADLATAKVPDKVTEAYEALRIGDFTFETALKQLEAQRTDPEHDEISDFERGKSLSSAEKQRRGKRLDEQRRTFSAMAAILRTEPRAVEKAGAAIRRGSAARHALLDALGSAGTPEAQRMLIEVMDTEAQGARLRQAAAHSLSRTEIATPKAVEALERYLGKEPLAQHALYGLGTIARRLAEAGEQERATRIAERLTVELKSAKTPSARVHALRALANAGNAIVFDTVKPFLADETTKVRGAAVDAIRLIEHQEVDGLIADRLLHDDERVVQQAAVEAIRLRAPTRVLVQALIDCMRTDTKVSVKLKAIAVMGAWRSKESLLQRELERIVNESTVPKLRDAARRALQS